jgi:hypothetical protein
MIERVELRDICQRGRTGVREAEEYPLLEAIAREQLLKTLRAGEDLVEISGGAVIACSSELCQ